MSYTEPLFLITDYRIDNVKEILPALELAARNESPLVIVAEEVEGQALAALIANSLRGTMQVSAINAPKFGEERREFLGDLALATGGTFITRASGLDLKKIQLKHFGRASTVEASKTFTVINGGKADHEAIKLKSESLKEQIKECDDLKLCEKIQERITRLVGGIATITVGANTEIEMIEKKHRIEDALEAVKAAIADGIVIGGGATLAKLSAKHKDDVAVDFATHKYGVEIVLKACLAPLKTIVENSGGSPDLVLEKILDGSFEMCYDVVNEKLVNGFEAGIVDPVRVTKAALQNAASAAGTLITTSHAIIEV